MRAAATRLPLLTSTTRTHLTQPRSYNNAPTFSDSLTKRLAAGLLTDIGEPRLFR